MCTLHSVPSSCTLCQPVLVVSTSDEKYRFGVPFKVLTKQVGLHTCRVVPCIGLYVVCGQVIVFTIASNDIRVTLKIIDMLQICIILFNSVHTVQLQECGIAHVQTTRIQS